MSTTFILGLVILVISLLALIGQMMNLSYYPTNNKSENTVMYISALFVFIGGTITVLGS